MLLLKVPWRTLPAPLCTSNSRWVSRTRGVSAVVSGTFYQALSQTAFEEDWARDSTILLARDGRRGLRCSPAHPRFVNIRGRAAYVDKHGMHRAARSSRE